MPAPRQPVRIVGLSDTHMRHERIAVPPCDLLVHAGDATRSGTAEELEAFLRWLAAQPARDKVLVAGNHDHVCERAGPWVRERCEALGIRYLEDEETTVAGLRVWGSPVTPYFRNMAFNRHRGAALRLHWDRVPEGLDVLVTHGPPRGLGDRMFLGLHVGCEDLLAAVQRARPRVHVYGHIHEGHGAYRLDGLPTRFYNVASSPLLVGRPRPPCVIELEPPVSGDHPRPKG